MPEDQPDCRLESTPKRRKPFPSFQFQRMSLELTHISSFSHVAEPLTNLTRKQENWTRECQDAFNILKAKIVNATELTPFDPTFPILLQMDASDYGLGAELLLIKDGKECLVSFTAHTLSPAE